MKISKELKYFSKNPKWFSVEDIKLKNNEVLSLNFIWYKNNEKLYYNLVTWKNKNWTYNFEIKKLFWKTIIKKEDIKKIIDLRENIKKEMVKLGFKDWLRNVNLEDMDKKVLDLNLWIDDLEKNLNNLKNDKKIKILEDIKLDFSEKDTRGNYRAILNWKTIFREKTKEDYEKRINEIKSFFQNWTLTIEKISWLPFKVKEENILQVLLEQNFNLYVKGENINWVNSKYLESPISKAKYVSSYYNLTESEFKELEKKLNNRQKNILNIFIGIFQGWKDIFRFTQDSYFPKLVEAYIILYKEICSKDLIKAYKPAYEKIIVEDGTHRLLAITNIIEEYKNQNNWSWKERIMEKIRYIFENIDIIPSKMLKGYYSFSELEQLDIKKIDEYPSNQIKEYIKNHN